jgi:hypothetical protein
MRVIKEITHPDYRTTIFNWNNKYIVKLETPMLEQTFKLNEYDVSSDDEVVRLLDDEFIQRAMKRFEEMAVDFRGAVERLG